MEECVVTAARFRGGVECAAIGGVMEYINAFVGKKEKPTEQEMAHALGSAAEAWSQFIEWIAKEQEVSEKEWKGICVDKYGWSLRLKKKGRNIVFLAPGEGCFLAAFSLSDRALKASEKAHLSRAVKKALADAPRYPEGTGLRLVVRKASDLGPIREIAVIKLAN